MPGRIRQWTLSGVIGKWRVPRCVIVARGRAPARSDHGARTEEERPYRKGLGRYLVMSVAIPPAHSPRTRSGIGRGQAPRAEITPRLQRSARRAAQFE